MLKISAKVIFFCQLYVKIMQKVMQTPQNSHAIGCIDEGVNRCFTVSYLTAQQAIEVKRVGKVVELSVIQHLDMADAIITHEFDHHPLTMGQSIDEVTIGKPQFIITCCPMLTSCRHTISSRQGVKQVVKPVDGKHHLIVVDASAGFPHFDNAEKLAEKMGARYFKLEDLDADRFAEGVKAAIDG